MIFMSAICDKGKCLFTTSHPCKRGCLIQPHPKRACYRHALLLPYRWRCRLQSGRETRAPCKWDYIGRLQAVCESNSETRSSHQVLKQRRQLRAKERYHG